MLALEMLMGRLELFPIFILFSAPLYELKNKVA